MRILHLVLLAMNRSLAPRCGAAALPHLQQQISFRGRRHGSATGRAAPPTTSAAGATPAALAPPPHLEQQLDVLAPVQPGAGDAQQGAGLGEGGGGRAGTVTGRGSGGTQLLGEALVAACAQPLDHVL